MSVFLQVPQLVDRFQVRQGRRLVMKCRSDWHLKGDSGRLLPVDADSRHLLFGIPTSVLFSLGGRYSIGSTSIAGAYADVSVHNKLLLFSIYSSFLFVLITLYTSFFGCWSGWTLQDIIHAAGIITGLFLLFHWRYFGYSIGYYCRQVSRYVL